MTPDEIKQAFPYTVPSRTSPPQEDLMFWVKEIAYQLAVQNDRAERAECQADADRQSFGPACAMYAKFLLEGSG